MTGVPSRVSMRKGATSPQTRPWYRIENHTLDSNHTDESKATIYIYDEIGDSWWGPSTNASDFVKEITALDVSNIELHLNSPGGDIFEGVEIYTALKQHDAKITVYVDSLAASAASFIAQAGDEVIMTDAAVMMIHDGSGLVWGNAADMRDTAALLDKLSNVIAGIYSNRAGQTVSHWRNLMIAETWFTAQEAVDAGLADRVSGTTPKDSLDAANKWDLSIFNHKDGLPPSVFAARSRIANQFTKENAVTDTSGTDNPQAPQTGSPETDPNAQTTQDAPEQPEQSSGNEGTEPGGSADPEESAPAGTAPGATPAGDPGTPTTLPPSDSLQNKAGQAVTFTVAGQQVTMSLEQLGNKMTELQTFQNESIVAGKKAFVKELHDRGQITGPQVEATEKFALSLHGEQYDAWKATYEGASGVPFLQNKVDGVSNPDGQQVDDAAQKQSEIDRCEAIVRSFKQSNMKEDQIKATPSYQTLVALKPDFKL